MRAASLLPLLHEHGANHAPAAVSSEASAAPAVLPIPDAVAAVLSRTELEAALACAQSWAAPVRLHIAGTESEPADAANPFKVHPALRLDAGAAAPAEPCPAAVQWAAALQAAPAGAHEAGRSPTALLRAVMEAQQHAAIAALTAYKPLLRRAEVDHYALFALERQLAADPNRAFIQDLLLREALYVQPNAEACAVLLLLRQYTASGAALWPAYASVQQL